MRPAFNLAARPDVLRKDPETARRVLRAFLRTEAFLRESPEEARRIVANRLGLDEESLASPWDGISFKVSLDQSLIATLENEARWAIRNGLAKGRAVPNFMEYIHFDALESVRPEAVTIIH